MYHVVLNIVCFETFSEKRKENELHRKYTLFGGSCRKPISSHNFIDKTNLMILFHLPWLGAQHHRPVFSNFWIINIWEANELFFSYFFCVACFYWKEIEYLKNGPVTVSATQFPTKWCPFQPPRSKTVGGDTFLVAKSQLFRRGQKHIKIEEIITMCQIMSTIIKLLIYNVYIIT